MSAKCGVGARRYTAHTSVFAYNAAHPDAPMPLSSDARNTLRSFTCAGAGLVDDLIASEKRHTLDFLPGGAPEPGEPDQAGTVVASRWGNPPYLVLAEQVPLRQAWKIITAHWPAKLSSAVEALRSLADEPSSEA
ncbi:hypothetical protein [Amycolatopsis sp. EV170708-02-1]|uniref:hypothetical protein n=1 Tax=Amycolatopsis sp. EV170708-02-1 TaxID=2919322 RepID=UPI001F0BCF1A|nr:hypothetical protein [Amycolatopsis sp. EV170708-02-1]UMP06778.1 hypothetical protein MJQ72_19070 [Amycolatopsis sp. EV170708-02-1]